MKNTRNWIIRGAVMLLLVGLLGWAFRNAPLAEIWATLLHLQAWQIDAAASQALAGLAQRTMQLQVTVQDGSVWIGDGTQTVEVVPQRLEL